MTYQYNKLTITLNEDEVYMLNDIILFALDYDVENNGTKLNDEKRKFAKKLANITDETKKGDLVMTKDEAKVVLRVLKKELKDILDLMPNYTKDEGDSIILSSLKNEAVALQKGIKLFEVLVE